MAANVSVPNNFVTGTPAVADDVDANFTSIVNWINTNAVHLDASKAFTNIPSGPASDPTDANHLTRKSYVDNLGNVRVGGYWQRSATAQTFPAAGTTAFVWDNEVEDASGFWASGPSITVPANLGGIYTVHAVIFNVGGLTVLNGGFGAIMQCGPVGVPFGYTPAFPDTCASSWTGPLVPGQSVSVAIKNNSASTAVTANCFLFVYRVAR